MFIYMNFNLGTANGAEVGLKHRLVWDWVFTPWCDHAIVYLQFQLYLSLQPLPQSDMIFLVLCAMPTNEVQT